MQQAGGAVLSYLLRTDFTNNPDQIFGDGQVLDDSPEIGAGSLTGIISGGSLAINTGVLEATPSADFSAQLRATDKIDISDGRVVAFTQSFVNGSFGGLFLTPDATIPTSPAVRLLSGVQDGSLLSGKDRYWYSTGTVQRVLDLPAFNGILETDRIMLFDETNSFVYHFAKLPASSDYELITILPLADTADNYLAFSCANSRVSTLHKLSIPSTLYTDQITPVFEDGFDRSDRDLGGDGDWVAGASGWSSKLIIASNKVDVNGGSGNGACYRVDSEVAAVTQAKLTSFGYLWTRVEDDTFTSEDSFLVGMNTTNLVILEKIAGGGGISRGSVATGGTTNTITCIDDTTKITAVSDSGHTISYTTTSKNTAVKKGLRCSIGGEADDYKLWRQDGYTFDLPTDAADNELLADFSGMANETLSDGQVLDDVAEMLDGSFIVAGSKLGITSGELLQSSISAANSTDGVYSEALTAQDGLGLYLKTYLDYSNVYSDSMFGFANSGDVNILNTLGSFYPRGVVPRLDIYSLGSNIANVASMVDNETYECVSILDKTNGQIFFYLKLASDSSFNLISIIPVTIPSTVYAQLSALISFKARAEKILVPDKLYTDQITPIIVDTFVDVNGTELPDHTPTPSGGFSWTAFAGMHDIQNDIVVHKTALNNCSGFDAGFSDVWLETKSVPLSATSGFAANFHWITDHGGEVISGYMVAFNEAGNTIQIYEVTSNSYALRASSAALAQTDPMTLRSQVTMVGGQAIITAILSNSSGGTVTVTYTDASPRTETTNVGIALSQGQNGWGISEFNVYNGSGYTFEGID